MKLEVSVRGVEPSVRPGPTVWRTAIASAIKERYPDAPFKPSTATGYQVEVEFHLMSHRMFIQPNHSTPPDVDNLLKRVLDTVFRSDRVAEPTGVLIDENDTYVVDVRAMKREAASAREQGVDISVRWRESVP
jgi:Holliday junction resolvase RusA-like endonuclease